MKALSLLLFISLLFQSHAPGQNLEELLNQKTSEQQTIDYTLATFKATRIINSHSIENPEKGDLMFLISHRFGELNGGFYEFFGLDNATTRLGLEQGITDRLAIGIGRNILYKAWDGHLKYKLLRQSTGSKNMPVSLSIFTSAAIETLKSSDPDKTYNLTNRTSYAAQLLIARKFSPKFSLQLIPTFIHKNLVERRIDQNNIFSLGAGGRFKITNRLTLNAEYFYLLPGQTADDFNDSFSVGFDIETGGHVFQLHLTNSTGMFEQAFITETAGSWMDGNIHFGFNIIRNFKVY